VQRTDILEHLDILILEVRLGNKTVLLINIYNGADNNTILTLMGTNIPKTNPVIITGDFNIHHPNWSLPDTDTSPISDTFIDWTERDGPDTPE